MYNTPTVVDIVFTKSPPPITIHLFFIINTRGDFVIVLEVATSSTMVLLPRWAIVNNKW